MGKLKPDRKSASSPQSMNRISMIISENWDEIWSVVQQRDQANQNINRQNLRALLQKSHNYKNSSRGG
jgi:hypothetical protein